MDVTKKITCIVPVYNTCEYLENCIDSLIHQSYPNIEVILINDGSTDRSPEICNYYAEYSKKIKVIHQENSGVSKARNTGLERATGDYITFCDSDDWISTDAYITMISYMQHSDANIAFFNSTIENVGNVSYTRAKQLPTKICTPYEMLELMKGEVRSKLLSTFFFSVHNKIYHRSAIFDKSNIPMKFNENVKYLEDGIFNLDSFKLWEKGFVTNTPFYHRNIRPNSAMNISDQKLVYIQMLQSYQIMIDKAASYSSKAVDIVKSARDRALIYYLRQLLMMNDFDMFIQFAKEYIQEESMYSQLVELLLAHCKNKFYSEEKSKQGYLNLEEQNRLLSLELNTTRTYIESLRNRQKRTSLVRI